MAYLSPRFDHDVFVSYSHADPDGIGRSPFKTWSQLLVTELIAEIRSLSADFRAIDVFIDRDLDPTTTLTDELKRRVDRSAVLMILMSEYYLESVWCAAERDWFDRQVRDRRDMTSRVFVIRAVPTDEARWPHSLRDSGGHALPGFRFHPPPERPDDVVAPYGFPDLVERNEAFRRELAQLRTWLTRRLRELRAAQATDAAKSTTAVPPRSSRLYLHAPSADDAVRAQIAAQLREAGYIVVEPAGTPQLGDPLRNSLVERDARLAAARRCDALLMVRARAESSFDQGDLFDIGVDEREQIEAARGAAMPAAILDLAETPPPAMEAFGVSRLDARAHGWTQALASWLRQALAARAPT